MQILQASDLQLDLHRQTLLQGINLQLNAGEILAVIGPNGAGKSSLVKALTGDLHPTAGQVLLNGRELSTYSLKEKALQLAMLPQQTELNFSFPVAEVVQLGRIPHATGLQEDKHIVEEALRAVDMLHLAQRPYTWLSGGEKQRVQLARVMAQIWRPEDAKTRLMVLDEPTSSLDVAHARQLMQGIQSMTREGLAVLMVLHDFNLAARYADRILLLKEGRQVAEGEPQQVLTEDHMLRYFDVQTRVIAHPESGKPMVFIDD